MWLIRDQGQAAELARIEPGHHSLVSCYHILFAILHLRLLNQCTTIPYYTTMAVPYDNHIALLRFYAYYELTLADSRLPRMTAHWLKIRGACQYKEFHGPIVHRQKTGLQGNYTLSIIAVHGRVSSIV